MSRFQLKIVSQFVLTACMIFLLGCENGKPGKEPEKQPVTVQPIVDPPRNESSNTEKAEKDTKATLDRLFALAKDGNCKGMPSMLIYRGENKAEMWKRSLSYSNPDERIEIEKRCGILQVLVMDLKETTFVEFSQEQESEGLWNIWEVKMDYLDGSAEKKFFAFLPINGGYALADID